MKKHKMEFAALSLLLVVLCYAYYDSNVKNKEQDIILTNRLLTMREIQNNEVSGGQIDEKVLVTEKKEDEKKKSTVTKTEIKKKVTKKKKTSSSIKAEVIKDVKYNESVSQEIVNMALKYVGNPYVYGGNSLTKGTDCSGFTKLIYAKYGVTLPRTSRAQSKYGEKISLKNIKPGDLVFYGRYGYVEHVGIYIGNNKIVNALNSKKGIVVSKLKVMPILDVRRAI